MRLNRPPTVLRWSTFDVPASNRFDYFADALASSMMPMSCSCRDPATFRLKLEMATLGPVTVTSIEGTAHRACRGRSEIGLHDDGSFHLVMPRSATCLLEHRGAMRLQSGDIALVDSRLGHDFTLGEGQRNIHLSLPADWIRQWLPTPEALVGRALPRTSAWVQALSMFASSLTPEAVVTAPLSAGILVDQVGSLLALVAADQGQPAVKATNAEKRLAERVRQRIVERSGEPGLGAEEVAQSLGISTRTLHRTLAAHGQTFGAMLIASRTDIALSMLRSSRFDRLTVAEISHRAGFADASHCARVVRRQAGMTPMKIRGQRA